MAAGNLAARNGERDMLLRASDGFAQRKPAREKRGDGGGQRATRAVSFDTGDERRGQTEFFAAIEENVRGNRSALEMPALDQRGATVTAMNFPCGGTHVVE